MYRWMSYVVVVACALILSSCAEDNFFRSGYQYSPDDIKVDYPDVYSLAFTLQSQDRATKEYHIATIAHRDGVGGHLYINANVFVHFDAQGKIDAFFIEEGDEPKEPSNYPHDAAMPWSGSYWKFERNGDLGNYSDEMYDIRVTNTKNTALKPLEFYSKKVAPTESKIATGSDYKGYSTKGKFD